jgi:SNF family Na+-dependent transporter
MAAQERRCATDMADGGPSLAFIAFPTALSMMPAAGFFSFLFFVMLLFLGTCASSQQPAASRQQKIAEASTLPLLIMARYSPPCRPAPRRIPDKTKTGIDSAFSMAEAFSNALTETLPYADHPAARFVPMAVCLLGLILGLPMTMEGGYYWFEWANHYIIFPLTLVACVECVGATWIRESSLRAILSDDISDMIGTNT